MPLQNQRRGPTHRGVGHDIERVGLVLHRHTAKALGQNQRLAHRLAKERREGASAIRQHHDHRAIGQIERQLFDKHVAKRQSGGKFQFVGHDQRPRTAALCNQDYHLDRQDRGKRRTKPHAEALVGQRHAVPPDQPKYIPATHLITHAPSESFPQDIQ